MQKIIITLIFLVNFAFSNDHRDSVIVIYDYPNQYKTSWSIIPGFTYSPNAEDGFIYLQVQRSLASQLGISATIDFHVRPSSKNLLKQVGPSEFYIYREDRAAFLGGITENYFLTDRLGFFAEALYGYTFGSLRGSSKRSNCEFFPIFSGGLSILISEGKSYQWLINLGYQYIGFSFNNEHSINISIPFRQGI